MQRTPSQSGEKLLNSWLGWPTICHTRGNSNNYGIFVIHDYKSRARLNRAKSTGKRRVLVAAGFLALILSVVSFVDLDRLANLGDANAADTGASLTQPLALPQVETGMAHDAPEPASGQPTPTVAAAESGTATPFAPSLLAGLGEESAPVTASIAVSTDEAAAVTTASAAPVASPDEPATPEPAEARNATATDLAAHTTREHTIAKGESLARIFAAQGLDAALLHRIVNSGKEAQSLARIRPGQTLRFLFDDTGELVRLDLQRSRIESLRVTIADDAIKVETVNKEVEKRIASAAGVIESSLFADGQKAGLSDGLIMELATIFGWDIDFALEIRAGDQFRLLYEEHYLDGEKLRDGAILAAEFTNRGTTHNAVRYENSNGDIGYYDDTGHSKRRAFIRTPIKFARISSGFNPKRWHPVLKRWRSHKGVDYAAPTGTPVKATGDGRVVFRGRKGGYGKTVIIEHAGRYTTLYAHLSGYSKRSATGNRVKQGQVIGYVGRTGLASGPHLHYEFRIGGVHKNPLKVKLPKTLPLKESELAKFREQTAPLLARLEAIPADTMIASAEASQTP